MVKQSAAIFELSLSHSFKTSLLDFPHLPVKWQVGGGRVRDDVVVVFPGIDDAILGDCTKKMYVNTAGPA